MPHGEAEWKEKKKRGSLKLSNSDLGSKNQKKEDRTKLLYPCLFGSGSG